MHSSCRVLNFKVEEDRSSYNPRHAYTKPPAEARSSQEAADGRVLNGLSKVKTARVADTPHLILVFMDENQRRCFVDSPKTIIAIQSRDIHRKTSLHLTSLLVLGKTSELL